MKKSDNHHYEIDKQGTLAGVKQIATPNVDDRPDAQVVDMIVIHNISLPPKVYGGNGIIELFTNILKPDEHPYYAKIHMVKVSSHFLIRRDGELIQFAPCTKRTWHAGLSQWKERKQCNDFSVGIELEGCDFEAFKEPQYQTLNELIRSLKKTYPIQHIVGHSDIAPGRKTDPGPCFDWDKITIPK